MAIGLNAQQFADMANRLHDPNEMGYSADSETGEYGPPGYYVSASKAGEVHFPPNHRVDAVDVMQHAHKVASPLIPVPGHARAYLGGWKDTTGDQYLDVSVRHQTLRRAMQRAIANRERAIYHSAPTGQVGGSVYNAIETDPSVPSELKNHLAGVAQLNVANPRTNPPAPTRIDVRAWQGGH